MPPETTLLLKGDNKFVSYHSITQPVMEEELVKAKKSKINQVWLSFLTMTALLSSGMSLGFTAIALPYMTRLDSTPHIDEDQASWIASLASISPPVGCLLGGHLLDRFGRRTGLLVIGLPMIIGFLLIGVRPTLLQLYLGRFSTGIGTGFCSIPATVYVAEVVDSSLRGMLVLTAPLSIATGVVIVYILGALLKSQWQLVALICAAFPVVTTVLVFFFLPESPVWLVSKNRIEDASNSLMRINRASSPKEVKEELQLLAEKAHKNQKRSMSITSMLMAMTRPESYKPFIIMNTFFLFQQLTGTFIVIFYAVDIVLKAGVKTDPFLVTVLIGVTRLVFTCVAAYMSKTYGRRPTSLTSGVGMTISLLTLATHVYLQNSSVKIIPSPAFLANTTGTDNTSLPVPNIDTDSSESATNLPIIMLLIYMVSGTLGFVTLPWSMIGEVYPLDIRGIAGGLTTSINYLLSFAMLKTYPFMKTLLHEHGVFYFFGIMAALGTLFVFLFLPETEGKTLQEIEMQFASKGSRPVAQTEEEEVALQNSKKATIVKSPQR